MIIKISSFAPTEDIYSAYWSLVQGLDLAEDLNIKDIMIDLTDNGGGYICLAYEMMFYMSLRPSTDSIPPFDFTQNYIQNQLAQKNAEQPNNTDTMWSFKWYNNAKTLAGYEDASWMTDGRELTRAFHTRKYSDLLTEFCQESGVSFPTHTFTPDRILLLSHGKNCSFFFLLFLSKLFTFQDFAEVHATCFLKP